MMNSSDGTDLAAIVREADAEILVAKDIDATTGDALGTAELGYYEAELGSLRDAAARLEAAENPAG